MSGSISFIDLEKCLRGKLAQQYQRIKCPECNKILRDPVYIVSCGHSLCKQCAETLIYNVQYSEKKYRVATCPLIDCDQELIDCIKCFSDNLNLREEVNTFLMTVMECCIGDCTWRGRVRDYEDHYSGVHLFLVQELPGKGVASVSQQRIALQVVTSKASFDSGIDSSVSLEHATPTVVLEDISNVLNTQMDHFNNEMVPGNTGFSSPVSPVAPPCETPSQQGQQLLSKQVGSQQDIVPIKHKQQPPVNKALLLSKRRQQSALKQGQKCHSRSFSLPPLPLNHVKVNNPPFMENVKTSVPRQRRSIRRRTSLTLPLVSADVPTPRKRPTSAKTTCCAVGLPSPTLKISLPPLKNTPFISPEQKPTTYTSARTPTTGECTGCKHKDLEIQHLKAELNMLKSK